jgi:WD40 repeat protein
LNNSNIIKVWNCVNSNCVSDIRDRINLFRGIAVVGDDQKLVSNSVENQSAKYWNITSIAFNNDILCSSFQNSFAKNNSFCSVRVWDVKNDSLIVEIPDLQALPISCIAISDDDNHVFTG